MKCSNFKTKRFILLILVFILTTIFITGCNVNAGKTAAQGVVKTYFNLLHDKNYEKALELYSPLFYEVTTREEWLSTMKRINEKLGDLKSINLSEWKVTKSANISNSGTYYTLKYNVEYSKFSSVEEITLFKPIGEKNIKIVGHNINSEGFLN